VHGGVIKDSGLSTRTSVASSIQLLSWSMRWGDDGEREGGSDPSGGEGEIKGLGCPTRTNVASSIQLFSSSTAPAISVDGRPWPASRPLNSVIIFQTHTLISQAVGVVPCTAEQLCLNESIADKSLWGPGAWERQTHRARGLWSQAMQEASGLLVLTRIGLGAPCSDPYAAVSAPWARPLGCFSRFSLPL